MRIFCYLVPEPDKNDVYLNNFKSEAETITHKQMTIYYLLGNIAFIELDHTQLVVKMTRV